MKYNSQQYAAALYEALADKNEQDARAVSDNFFALLKKNGDFGLLKKIAESFEKYARKKNGIFAGKLVLAHPLSEENKSALIEKIKKFMSETRAVLVNDVIFEEKYDAELIGGCKVMIGDVLIDMSVSGALERMQKLLSSTDAEINSA